MQLRKLTLLFFLTLLLSSWGYSQNIVADSLSKRGLEQVEKQIDKNLADKLFWVKIATGIVLSSLSGYAIYLGLIGFKKIVENVIKAKAEALVEEKISKSTGLKLEELQQFFNEMTRQKNLLASTRVAVVNNQGKYLILDNILTSAGFKTDDYRKMDKLPEELDITKCEVVLVDNTDGQYKEEELIRFFEKHKDRTKIVYLANQDLSDDNFQKYRHNIKIVKLLDRLGDAIKQARS